MGGSGDETSASDVQCMEAALFNNRALTYKCGGYAL